MFSLSLFDGKQRILIIRQAHTCDMVCSRVVSQLTMTRCTHILFTRFTLDRIMSTAIWEIPDFYHLDNDFFWPQEKKQLQTAYDNFLMNTKCRSISMNERIDGDKGNDDDDHDGNDSAQMLLQSKIQLFQLFVRTQPVNIRSFR
jgi:hypothetical protein